MTYEEAKKIIANKYNLGDTLVTGHMVKYFDEAAKLMMEDKPKSDIWETGKKVKITVKWNGHDFDYGEEVTLGDEVEMGLWAAFNGKKMYYITQDEAKLI